ncbi:hypothetical protein, partial [Rhizobium leguminosarum]|uniref:hypothetical protein n=1 Tax=Rhizobium leguminosarum TaxID=384 RepID=UPI003F9AF1D4
VLNRLMAAGLLEFPFLLVSEKPSPGQCCGLGPGSHAGVLNNKSRQASVSRLSLPEQAEL